jgi:undecaprenyl-diphosphatase
MQLLSVLQHADLKLFGRLFKLGEKRLIVPFARALSRSGDGYLHLLVPLLLGLSGAAQLDRLLTLLLLALAVERALYFSLKNSLRRRRPADYLPGFRSLVTASDQFSFPSGHTSAAFLLATSLCLVYGEPSLVMYGWATGVALSRVVLGVHFPGDTVAGALMGTTTAIGCAHFLGMG